MLDAFALQQIAEVLAGFNCHCTNQNRLVSGATDLDFSDDRIPFGLAVHVNEVFRILTNYRAVGRNSGYIQFINFLELVRFCLSRTGHAGQLVIHTEIVLEGDRGHSQVFLLNPDAFFGFNGLVQTFAETAAMHCTPGKLVDNDDFASIADHIFFVAMEQHTCEQTVVKVRDHVRIVAVVDVFTLHQVEHLQFAFDFFDTLIC